ncbi:alanine racemase, catabolic [Escherichia coli]|uniref:Alanine racemase, catabolic n=1 Tax=Escherichia coli TaxID=562 RepID=A0A377DUD5_ECOLX|nr:alanine racemase, catabolic [Escherichia coli]
MSNSAATLWHPEAHFDWVRPGIILYGASPSGQWRDIANTGLRPVMTLSSEIIGVQTLKAGERVGYGGRYTARDEQRIGIVAAGYADGYPRHAPTGTPVLVDGVRHHDGGDRLDGYASGRFKRLARRRVLVRRLSCGARRSKLMMSPPLPERWL